MANSTFPIIIQPRGASNAAVIRGWETGELPFPPGMLFWWRQVVRFAASEFTPAAATSQEIDLNVTYPTKPFPANVTRMPGAFIRVKTPISGGVISAATAELGDTGDPNGILTASNVFTGAAELVPSTPAAAENIARFEAAYAPTLTIRLTGANMTAITAGRLVVCIPFRVLVP